MRKYDMRICKCGKIHMIPFDKIQNAIENDKNFMFICADCGDAKIIGANKEYDEYESNKDCYMMYAGEFSPYKSEYITADSFKGTNDTKAISEICYSYGIKVPMMNGYYATEYHNGILYDGRSIANLYEIDRPNVTAKEVQEFLKKARDDARTVNMTRFINETREDILQEISQHYIKGFNWKSTGYEN